MMGEKRANLQENPKNQARDLTKVLGIILEFPQFVGLRYLRQIGAEQSRC